MMYRHIVIHGWMVSILGLSGNDLIVFAVIYGFSMDGKTEFNGSLSYIRSWIGCSEDTVRRSISYLENKGFIVKKQSFLKNEPNRLTINISILDQIMEKADGWGSKMQGGGLQNATPDNKNVYNNIIDNNIIYNNSIPINARERDILSKKNILNNLPVIYDNSFMELFKTIAQSEKWAEKTHSQIEFELKELSRYDKEYASELVNYALKMGYKTCTFPDSMNRYNSLKSKKTISKEDTVSKVVMRRS